MNSRRSFLKTLLAAGAGFGIMPSAVFEPRRWKRVGSILAPFGDCSLTRATIQPFTREMFESQGYREVDMAKIYLELERQLWREAWSKFKDLPLAERNILPS